MNMNVSVTGMKCDIYSYYSEVNYEEIARDLLWQKINVTVFKCSGCHILMLQYY